jgi:hypothetical protein
VTDPWKVARGIVQCAENPQREVIYGPLGRLLAFLCRLAPPLYDRFAPGAFAEGLAGRPARATPGNVLSPVPGVLSPVPGAEAIDGSWRSGHRRKLAYAFLATTRGGLRNLVRRPRPR